MSAEASTHLAVQGMPLKLESGAAVKDKNAFLGEIVEPLVGWLDLYAAARTIDLLDFQTEHGVHGALMEIGLYYGKYFSVLLRSGLLTGERVVGLDTFDYVPYDTYQVQFRENAQLDNFETQAKPDIKYLKAPSTDFDAPALLAACEIPPRFISIDGSHEFDDVYWDLRVAEQILAPKGIIAADDFLNHACLGVNEAITRFLISAPTLVPFAYVCNKLFCCRPNYADWYKAEIERVIMADESGHPKSELFKTYAQSVNRKQVECVYMGRKIITIPL